jgi:hypothetical protein
LAGIDIREVSGRRDLTNFIELPNRLYGAEKFYIPYLSSDRRKFLNKKKNPFFHHSQAAYYMAYKNGTPVGRIAAVINDLHNQYHGEKTGFFGFFDCFDDFDVARSLLSAAEDFVHRRGMSLIRGPMNFSTNDEIGLLIEGYESYPVFMMTWNPAYYIELYEKLHLKKAEDVLAYYLDEKTLPSERVLRVVDKIKARSRITVRTVNMNDFHRELELIRTIYNNAWSKNWGFVPMTPEEFNHIAGDFKKIIDPELVILAFVDNEPAGFSLAMPDYNVIFKKMNGKLFPLGLLKFLYYTKIHKIMTGARIMTLGIVDKYRNLGLDMVLYYETFTRGTRRGFHWGELSWILERNTLMNKGAAAMGARIYKRYRVFEKPL